jgi:hypothetical protein
MTIGAFRQLPMTWSVCAPRSWRKWIRELSRNTRTEIAELSLSPLGRGVRPDTPTYGTAAEPPRPSQIVAKRNPKPIQLSCRKPSMFIATSSTQLRTSKPSFSVFHLARARTAGRRDWSILPTVWYRVRNAHGTATMRHVNLGSRAISEKPERTRRSDSQHRRHAGGISGNGRRAPFPRQIRHPFDAEAPSGVRPACDDSIPRELSERCRSSPDGFR